MFVGEVTRIGFGRGLAVQLLLLCNSLPLLDFMDRLASRIASNWLNGYNGSDFTSTVPVNAAAGDINGDGIPDLIFGASTMTVNGNANAGEVYVVFGHKNSINNPWPTSAFNLNGL